MFKLKEDKDKEMNDLEINPSRKIEFRLMRKRNDAGNENSTV